MPNQNEAIKEIKKKLNEMLNITDNFLEQISAACKPYTLAELIGEIMPRMVYAIGGRKEWYEYIEEGKGLHGEKLHTLSISECKLLEKTRWDLSIAMNLFFDQLGAGSEIRKVDATFSSIDRTRLQLETEMKELQQSQEKLTLDIAAQTHGYINRTKKGTSKPLSYQIRSVYELSNSLSQLDTSLDKYLSLGIPKPKSLIQKNSVIEKLEKIGIKSVTPYIQKAESKLLKNDFPTACHEARKSLAQIQTALLYALESAISGVGNKFEFSADEVRQRCKDKLIYDSGNFNAHFKNNEKYFKGLDDKEHIELSPEGLTELAEVIVLVAKQ